MENPYIDLPDDVPSGNVPDIDTTGIILDDNKRISLGEDEQVVEYEVLIKLNSEDADDAAQRNDQEDNDVIEDTIDDYDNNYNIQP